jgi:membrane associated rhomboid family serine protease
MPVFRPPFFQISHKLQNSKEPFLSKVFTVTFSELSAFVAYFLVTLIFYVCATMITLNQPWIFMKFITDRNFQFSPISDKVGAANFSYNQQP